MKNIPFDNLLTDAEIDNEIDELFLQLGHFEPPVDMVANIMHAVAQLPPLKQLSMWEGFNFFEVNFDEASLC